jgi:hypothetical protein
VVKADRADEAAWDGAADADAEADEEKAADDDAANAADDGDAEAVPEMAVAAEDDGEGVMVACNFGKIDLRLLPPR